MMTINQMIEEDGAYIYRYAMKLTCHPQEAEDLTQKTFISAWKNLKELREEGAVRKWLRTICYHQFLMDVRKKKQEDVLLVENLAELETEGMKFAVELPEPEEEVLVEEAIRGIQNGCFYAMARKLTLDQRIAFSLVDMFGLPVSEVAELLDISVNAAKGLLHRARLNLEAFFADHCNLLDAKNPCRCQAWINFQSSHEQHQKDAGKIVSLQNLSENRRYVSKRQIRDKLFYLYHNMPQEQPSPEWFQKIIESLK